LAESNNALPALVTGATGFLGSAIVRVLLAAGRPVRVLARPGSDRRNLAGLPVDIAEGSLGDYGSLERALAGCGSLFHVAADYRLWVPDPAEMYRANVDGTTALMEAALAAGIERIVHTSSVATLGLNADGSPADEATPVTFGDMIGPYKRSKFLAEETVRSLIRDRNLPAIIVNPSTPVGPRDLKPTPTGRLVIEAAAGRMPAFVDTGLNLAHVDDIATGHLLAFEHGRIGERYVLGGEDLTLAEILRAIAGLTGRKPPTLRLPAGLILPLAYGAEAWARLSGREPFVTVDGVRLARKRMFFSSAKAERELRYRHRPALEGLSDAIEWFRRDGRLG
jgi:dihydroflavonol-4-reductase